MLGLYFIGQCYFKFGTSFPCWAPIRLEDCYLIGGIVISSLVGQFSYVEAYRKGQLNFLAGFDYLKFLFAAAIGYMVFSEVIESTTFYGALVILVCSYLNTKEEFKNTSKKMAK
ncbi:MAG: DMT family transporter [Holosporaceae bacterium]|nr:MAG: DMT family transporter [Holosporaceae bacterium]